MIEGIGIDRNGEGRRAFAKGRRPRPQQLMETGLFDMTPLGPGDYHTVHSGKDPAIKFKNRSNPDEYYELTVCKKFPPEEAERLKREFLASHPEASKQLGRFVARRNAKIGSSELWEDKIRGRVSDWPRAAKNRRTKDRFRKSAIGGDQNKQTLQTTSIRGATLETLAPIEGENEESENHVASKGNSRIAQRFEDMTAILKAASRFKETYVDAGGNPNEAGLIIQSVMESEKQQQLAETQPISFQAIVIKHVERILAAKTARDLAKKLDREDEDNGGDHKLGGYSIANDPAFQELRENCHLLLEDKRKRDQKESEENIIKKVSEVVKEELKKSDVDSRPVRTGGERIGTLDPASIGEILPKQLRMAIDLINLVRMSLGEGPIEDTLRKYNHDMKIERAKMILEKKGYKVKPPVSHQDLDDLRAEINQRSETFEKKVTEELKKESDISRILNLLLELLSKCIGPISNLLLSRNNRWERGSELMRNAMRREAEKNHTEQQEHLNRSTATVVTQ